MSEQIETKQVQVTFKLIFTGSLNPETMTMTSESIGGAFEKVIEKLKFNRKIKNIQNQLDNLLSIEVADVHNLLSDF